MVKTVADACPPGGRSVIIAGGAGEEKGQKQPRFLSSLSFFAALFCLLHVTQDLRVKFLPCISAFLPCLVKAPGRRTFCLFLASLSISIAFIPCAKAADEPCRIAFDIGSSGIRAGSTSAQGETRREIDFLGGLWANQGLQSSLTALEDALRELPRQANFRPDCATVAGGFSAWRLALEKDPSNLIQVLQQLQRHGSTPVLVIPQEIEGKYGYVGAQKTMGPQLQTSHILDVGGGSLQIASAQSSWGKALGQKAWRKLLCRELRHSEHQDCNLEFLSTKELAQTRRLADLHLHTLNTFKTPARTEFPANGLTAISRPVTGGLHPALLKLKRQHLALQGQNEGTGVLAGEGPSRIKGEVEPQYLSLQALSSATDLLAPLNMAEQGKLTGTLSQFLPYLLTDMLLVEGVLRNGGFNRLYVGDVVLSNIPGILADEQAYRWTSRYDCYLQRLAQTGLSAYFSDPTSCPMP